MSIRWLSVVTWAVSVMALWVVLTPGVLSSTGLMWISMTGLALLAIVLLSAARSHRTVSQVIADVDAEPVLAVAAPPTGGSAERLRGAPGGTAS